MNAAKVNGRLKRLAVKLCPPSDGTFTLEELCRSIWCRDKGRFLEIAKDSNLSYFTRRFEYEVRNGSRGRAIGRKPSVGD